MTCVYKEFEIKTKMVQEQLMQVKWTFCWVKTWKMLFRERGIKSCWRPVESIGVIFQRKAANFGLVGENTPFSFPSRENLQNFLVTT